MAFLGGIIVYSLDTLIFLYSGIWTSIAFHVFTLWMLWIGYRKVDEYMKVTVPGGSIEIGT